MKRAHRNEDCAGLVLLEGKEGGVQILDPSPEFGLIAVWREYYHDDELRKKFCGGNAQQKRMGSKPVVG